MPKETIHHTKPYDHDAPPVVSVGWQADYEVTLTVAPVRKPQVDPEHTLTIMDALLADLVAHDPQKWAETSNYGQAARTAIAVYERGWHAQLDRAQLNRLIRTLRRARDTAYGADA